MPETSLVCITCDRSPQWANHGQCFGCLLDHSKPCDYVPKFATHTDLAVAVAEICQYRATWEAMHPLWELVPDMERLWPESAAPSQHADYATTIGRKLVHARWKVERRHPRGAPAWLRPFKALGYRIVVGWDVGRGHDQSVTVLYDPSGGVLHAGE
jgi:hypothetical protein